MSRAALGWLPSAGLPVSPQQLVELARSEDPGETLRRGLRARLGVQRVALRASGREALRALLASAAARLGRDEVVVPAYTCFSVPAAAAASGMRIRLVEVTPQGQIDPEALAALPLERAAAVVVCNLFGIPEPVRRVRELARDAGALVIDDAAQALGARDADGPVGGRGDAGILSFGRGKPLSGLGGGAIVTSGWLGELTDAVPARAARLRALVRAAAYNAALQPLVFRTLCAVPALEIGETHFDVGFRRGPIDAASMTLAAVALADLDAAAARRGAVARELSEQFAALGLEPLTHPRGVHPRIYLLAASASARDAALASLRRAGTGASGLYPGALDAVPPLAPHLVDVGRYPVARDLAARLLTLPAHAGLTARLAGLTASGSG